MSYCHSAQHYDDDDAATATSNESAVAHTFRRMTAVTAIVTLDIIIGIKLLVFPDERRNPNMPLQRAEFTVAEKLDVDPYLTANSVPALQTLNLKP